jgi:hypothetical protein
VSDFFGELRRGLVGAHERHARSRRRSAALRPRSWRPAVAIVAAIAVAGAVGLLVAVSVLVRSTPRVAAPRVVAVVSVGGLPQDATFAAGSVWVTEDSGDIVRLDPGARRVVTRIAAGQGSASITGDRDGVWVGSATGELIQVDAGTNRVGARIRRQNSGILALGAGGLWFTRAQDSGVLERLDPASGRVTARVDKTGAGSLAASGDALWDQTGDGSVVEIDGARGRAVRRFTGIAPLSGATSGEENGLVADEEGAWVTSVVLGTLTRLGADGVVQRIDVGTAPTALAQFDGAVWVASGDALHGGYRISRVDPADGRIVAKLELGAVRPTALVPAGRELWAICTDGNARVIRPS